MRKPLHFLSNAIETFHGDTVSKQVNRFKNLKEYKVNQKFWDATLTLEGRIRAILFT